jgi:hypothetical protein
MDDEIYVRLCNLLYEQKIIIYSQHGHDPNVRQLQIISSENSDFFSGNNFILFFRLLFF